MAKRPVDLTRHRPRLVVEERPVTALTPYGNNARRHGEAQIAKIANSIRTFGFVNPILIDGEGQVVAGHGRLEAAERLGLATVPTICIEHMSDADLRAYRLADNRIAASFRTGTRRCSASRSARLSTSISTPASTSTSA